jgi:formate hydrogenlyase subunit 3/multisubunit Na+/H+ antiporter MnhD subunit
MGLGLAMLGRSAGRPEWVVLGLAGCLLHVWNHFLFKSLLFLGAGAVVHRTHTREIDQLGGLARTMPWTAAMFLIGALAICGLAQWGANYVVVQSFPGMAESIGLVGTYALYTVAAVISIFLVQSFIKETKGKELEDMTG